MLSHADRRRMMTPSGRINEAYGAPRPVGPTQNLVPVGPTEVMSPNVAGRTVRAGLGQAAYSLVAMPKLDSPLVQSGNLTAAIPWYQMLVNIYRLTQPTGVVPGTYLGITFNAFGQAISAEASGVTIDSPHLTGNPTAPNPPANDNSQSIATTAWVQGQGYLTSIADQLEIIHIAGDAVGQGEESGQIPVTVVALQNRPISAAAPAVGQALIWNGSSWVPGQAGIPDAPADGQRYVRQNGQWVVIVSP